MCLKDGEEFVDGCCSGQFSPGHALHFCSVICFPSTCVYSFMSAILFYYYMVGVPVAQRLFVSHFHEAGVWQSGEDGEAKQPVAVLLLQVKNKLR